MPCMYARCGIASSRPMACCDTRRSCDSEPTSCRTSASDKVGATPQVRAFPQVLVSQGLKASASRFPPPTEPGDGGTEGRVVRERAHVDATALHEPPPPPAKALLEKKINFSNLKKIFWPAGKYTKGDLIDYYRGVAKWLLPYLAKRPIVLT